MSLYSDAVESIRSHIESTQQKLDSAATEARQISIATLRKMALESLTVDSDAYHIGQLVANTMTIGREDGYPLVNIPKDTKSILKAALRAGILHKCSSGEVFVGTLAFHEDFSGLRNRPDVLDVDYMAWRAAYDYRNQQTHKEL